MYTPPEPYWEVHEGNGPFLLLVHGFLCSRALWMLNIDALSEIAQPVIVELFGHGRSPAPETGAAYRPQAYIEVFEKIRERLGASEWLLCGQSLGAGITLRYALTHPERIIAQVFTNSISALGERDNADRAQKIAKEVQKIILVDGRKGLEKLPIHPLRAHRFPDSVRAALVKDLSTIDLSAAAHTMGNTLPEASVRQWIHKNTVPTLLVCGKQETRFEPFKTFAKLHMPLLDIVDLDAGHAVNVEAPDGFNDAVTTFFRKHIRSI